jgi:hypothetical protein
LKSFNPDLYPGRVFFTDNFDNTRSVSGKRQKIRGVRVSFNHHLSTKQTIIAGLKRREPGRRQIWMGR